MNICEVLILVSFIMVTIIAISQYIDSNVPKVCNVLELMNVLPCYEIKAFKGIPFQKTSTSLYPI